jgi:hypothetical protein
MSESAMRVKLLLEAMTTPIEQAAVIGRWLC